jgi:DNA-binding protein HU-beta
VAIVLAVEKRLNWSASVNSQYFQAVRRRDRDWRHGSALALRPGAVHHRPVLKFRQGGTVKKTVLALVVAAATGVALSAQAPAASSQAPAAKQTAAKTAPKAKSQAAPKETKEAKAPAKAKAHVETAEVVSTDATAKSITVKPATGDNQTYTATGAAVAQLAKVKAGEQVRLTIRDNDVTSIRAAHAMKSSGAKKAPAAKKTESK